MRDTMISAVAIFTLVVFAYINLANAKPSPAKGLFTGEELNALTEVMDALVSLQAKEQAKGKSGKFEDEEEIDEKNGVASEPHMYGDLLLTPEQERVLLHEGPGSGVGTAQAFLVGARLWPNGVVSYELDRRLNSHARSAIGQAMNELSSKSCLQFVHRAESNAPDYIYFTRDNGCFSSFGMTGGRQILSIGRRCELKGIVQHEILHALGRIHEQSRPDRDNFVTIIRKNIKKGMEHNFDKMRANTNQLPYDYGSVMHYKENAFGINGRQTIIPHQQGVSIGQRNGLSATDWEHLRVYCGFIEQFFSG